MIELRTDQLKASILPRGASLAGLWCGGVPHSLVLGSTEPQAYAGALAYFGAIIGPVANRIRDASILIDGRVWQMEANEGPTCLHSGAAGLHARDWQVSAQSARSVEMTCDLRHGECGLPGSRRFVARYDLEDAGLLRLTLLAKSDRTTVVNLAHHPYWNLTAAPTVAHHTLQVFGAHFLPVDARNLPRGQIAPVQGSDYDFLQKRPVPTDIGLDANICLATTPAQGLRPAAILTADAGVTLHIDTTEPGLQVYNGSGLSPVDASLHDNRRLDPFAGIALEPQRWPDAPHHRAFPSILLNPGQTYRQETTYRISP